MRTSIETLKDAGSALMSDAVQGEVGPYFTCVNHDIYKITASCNISAPTGLPTGSWTIEEVVKLGTGEELRDIPVAIDRSKDFQPISQNNSNEHRRSYDFRDSPSEFTPVQITFRDEDKTYNEADPPQHFLLPPTAPPLPHSFEPLDADTVYSKSGITGMYLPRNGGKALTSNAQWGGPFDPEADASGLFEVANEDTQVHLVVTHTGQSTDYEEVRVADITNPGSGYPDLGTLSVTLMVKAVEWEPESYSGRKYLFTARAYDEQEQQASETGRSELFIENGNLVLYVEDDNGEWGRLDYDLSGGKFPSDTWMHIRANFCGNKPGQMALFVDGRYCDATYSASAEKGDNYEVHESVPLRKPVMTQAFLTGGRDSLRGLGGWFSRHVRLSAGRG
ncbi:MAG: hypothetical protein U5N86_09165 [Planctomycetota bacterium]|nr:hypothetical protein [Planctomycetota bacterium]